MTIKTCRLLNIKVINENNEEIYTGMIEDAPEEIKNMEYKTIEGGNPMIFYV